MGYHLRDEAAAEPRVETRETGGVLTGFQTVGSGYRYYSSELGRCEHYRRILRHPHKADEKLFVDWAGEMIGAPPGVG